MNSSTAIYDICIVGAGPAGLTAAIFASKKELSVLLADGARAGGQLVSLYPNKPVYNYPGYSRISAAQLAARMIAQVHAEGILLSEHSPVQEITHLPDGLFQMKSAGGAFLSRSIILACGMGLIEPRRLQVPGEQQLARQKVFYDLQDLEAWTQLEVAVVGGGNSALDNAVLLGMRASTLFLIHQLPEFQAERSTVERLLRLSPKLYLEWKTVELREKDGKLLVKIRKVRDAEEQTLRVDRMLVNVGLRSNLSFLEKLPVTLRERHILVDSEMKTSLPGVFACGDAVAYPGKVRLIVTAIGEAATAVGALEAYLQEKTSGKVLHG